MRGKLALAIVDFDTIGITPADAGKTLTLQSISKMGQDHPRGCGENNKVFTFSA